MKRVFVNADDFGLHEDINRAIAEGAKQGRIQGVSVSANGLAVDWTLLEEMIHHGVMVGSHLTWADEAWLTGPGGCSRTMIMRNLLVSPVKYAGKLRDEARAQIERMLEHNIQPSHVDSHQHIHVLPRLWPVTLALAREYSIPRIRIPMASSVPGTRKSPGGICLQGLSRLRHRNVPTAWPCAGIARSGHNTSTHLRRELNASSAGIIEMIVHPAYATDSLRHRYQHWGYEWEAERSILMGDEWPCLLKECGFEVLSAASHRNPDLNLNPGRNPNHVSPQR